MFIGFDVASFQLVNEHIHSRCVLISGYYHAVYFKIILSENIYKSENLQIIGDSEILACLAVDDVPGIYAYYDFRLILHLLQKLYLCVFIKSREHSHSMLVVNQLAAEFQIQSLSPAAVYPLQDILRLFFIFLPIFILFYHFYKILSNK